MLDAHRLRVFRAVVAAGSVQEAARLLSFTPSAVSQHIVALQRETGLALFTKDGRGIRATQQGLALADEVDAVLEKLGDVEALVTALRSGNRASLSVAYFASIGTVWMPQLIAAFATRYPDVRLELRVRDELPTRQEAPSDLQIVVDRSVSWQRERGGGARWEHLIDDPYLAVIPRAHHLAGRASIALAELQAEVLIDNDAPEGWCRRVLLESCAAAGFSPRFLIEAHDYPTAMAFVTTGIGITVVPSLAALAAPRGTVAVPIADPVPSRSISLVVRDGLESREEVAFIREHLRAIVDGVLPH